MIITLKKFVLKTSGIPQRFPEVIDYLEKELGVKINFNSFAKFQF